MSAFSSPSSPSAPPTALPRHVSRRRGQVARRFRTLAGMTILGAAGVALVTVAWSYRIAEARALAESHSTVRLLAHRTQGLLDIGERALERMARLAADSDLDDPATRQRLGTQLREFQALMPEISRLFVADRQGLAVASSLYVLPDGLSAAGRAHFEVHRSRTIEGSYAEPVLGQTDGRPNLVVSRAISPPELSPSGVAHDGFQGTVSLSLPVDALAGFLSAARPDVGEVFGLYRRDGQRVAHHPPLPHADLLNGALPAPAAMALDASPTGAAWRRTTDQGPTLGVVRPVPGHDFVMTLERPVAELRLAWLMSMLPYLAAFAVGAVGLAGGLFALGRWARAEDAWRDDLEATVANRTQALQQAVDDKVLLMHEVNHRVKNSLQIVSSLLHMQAREASPEVRAQLSDATARISAVSRVHERLYHDNDVTSVSAPAFLSALCGDLSTGTDSLLTVDADPLDLPAEKAILVGLLVAELVNNVLKHGLPACPDPAVPAAKISLKRADLACGTNDATSLVLTVRDWGRGLPADFDTTATRSLGLRLVHTLLSQLGGRLEACNTNPGACFRLLLPQTTQP